jgi:TolB protein
MVDRLRRSLALGVPAALALRPFAAAAQAPLRIEITEGVIEPMPFAAPAFVPDTGAAADMAARITQVVIDDLVGSGLFREIPRGAHIGQVTNFDAPVRFADWKAINAQALVTASRCASGSGTSSPRPRSARGCSSKARCRTGAGWATRWRTRSTRG